MRDYFQFVRYISCIFFPKVIAGISEVQEDVFAICYTYRLSSQNVKIDAMICIQLHVWMMFEYTPSSLQTKSNRKLFVNWIRFQNKSFAEKFLFRFKVPEFDQE